MLKDKMKADRNNMASAHDRVFYKTSEFIAAAFYLGAWLLISISEQSLGSWGQGNYIQFPAQSR